MVQGTWTQIRGPIPGVLILTRGRISQRALTTGSRHKEVTAGLPLRLRRLHVLQPEAWVALWRPGFSGGAPEFVGNTSQLELGPVIECIFYCLLVFKMYPKSTPDLTGAETT